MSGEHNRVVRIWLHGGNKEGTRQELLAATQQWMNLTMTMTSNLVASASWDQVLIDDNSQLVIIYFFSIVPFQQHRCS